MKNSRSIHLTHEEVNDMLGYPEQRRKLEIQEMRKDLLNLNPLKRLSKINDLYFDGKISDEEFDSMKKWYFECF